MSCITSDNERCIDFQSHRCFYTLGFSFSQCCFSDAMVVVVVHNLVVSL